MGKLSVWLFVMLVSVNYTQGGYSVVGQGMTWIECRSALVNAGSGTWVDDRGNMRSLECLAEDGDPDS